MKLSSIYYRTKSLTNNIIPLEARSYLMHRRSKRQFYRYMKQKMGHFVVEIDPGSMPPRELLMTTSLQYKDDIDYAANANIYFGGGYANVLRLLETLETCSFNIRTVGSVLDFGCGTGRHLRVLRCIEGIRLAGTDVNRDIIEWCQHNLNSAQFYVNELKPPLKFAEDEIFDLIYAYSVFTHIRLDLQHQWLEEMSRILRPGGYFICSVLGLNHIRLMLDVKNQEQLAREGHFTIEASNPKASYSTQVVRSWDVFQTREHVLQSFGAVFDVLDFVPAYQNLVILRKPRG